MKLKKAITSLANEISAFEVNYLFNFPGIVSHFSGFIPERIKSI